MTTHFRIFFAIISSLAAIEAPGQQATKQHRDSLEAIVNQYYTLNINVFRANSSPGDIDKVFELFTDDFEYIHPKYGGTYTRADLYKGYLRNQQNGAYNGSVTGVEVINKIIGLNAVVVQKRFLDKEQGPIGDGPEMTLFEFRGGKISRIVEYW